MRGLNVYVLLLAAAAALALAQTASAQYDAECHYECITIYCGLFDDYCDYDCHEVCYPYRKSAQGELKSVDSEKGGEEEFLETSVLGGAKTGRRQQQRARESSATARTGKVVRMRILSPAGRQGARMNTATGRSSPALGRFALFQSCLSNSGIRSQSGKS